MLSICVCSGEKLASSFFLNLVSINQMKLSVIPACSSIVCFFSFFLLFSTSVVLKELLENLCWVLFVLYLCMDCF